jgi:hypothetical protein
MALGHKSEWILSQGSNIAVMLPAESTLTTFEAALELPIISNTEFTLTPNQELIPDEAGNNYSVQSTIDSTLSFEVLQKDLDTLDFVFAPTQRGKYFSILKQVNATTIDSDKLYQLYPKCKYVGGATFTAPGAPLTLEFVPENPAKLVTFNLASFANAKFGQTLTGNVAVADGEFVKHFAFPL